MKSGDIPQPQSATCIAISKDLTLGGIQAAAVFTFDTHDVYSVVRARDSFFSFKNEILLRESDYTQAFGDTIDAINIIRGRSDAYIDPRAFWGEQSGAGLQTYDVAAVIPIVLGLGFTVSDIYGKSWQKYGLNDPIPLVISRSKRLHGEILDAVKPLMGFEKGGNYERATTTTPIP